MKSAQDSLASNLKRLRSEHRLTQSQVAEAIDVSLRSYQKYEQRETFPDDKNLDRLAKAFKCRPGDLLADAPIPQDSDVLIDAAEILRALNKKGPATRLGVLFLLTREERYADRLRAIGAGPIAQGLMKLPKVF